MKRPHVAFFAAVLALGCGEPTRRENDGELQRESVSTREKEPTFGSDVVVLSPEALAANHVQTVEVGRGSSWITERFPGRVEFNRNTTAVVHSPLEGRLREWRINVGDTVKKGEELALVESPQNLGNTVTLRAPIGGEVVDRTALLDEWVQPSDALVVITNPSSVWVAAQVREDRVGKIRTEAPPSVHVLSFLGETFTGKLLRVGSTVSPETRTVEFVFEVPNSQRKLRSGMFAYVSLATDRVDDGLFVPDEALQTIAGRPVVFVEQAPGNYRVTGVHLGRKAGEMVEILDGVPSGARVVTSGGFVLKSEAVRSAFASEGD